ADVAQAVRQVVADYVRRKKAIKRDAPVVSDDAAFDRASLNMSPCAASPEQKLAIHQALERLQADQPRAAKVVFYRFYCELSMPQIAEVLGVSTRAAERDWARARSWLEAELGGR
ncbi:MAG: ECF-type sigma factor, partial [Myxococcota bacterium]